MRANEAAVACIFTDLKLAGDADGLDVVAVVTGTLPRVPVVLTSGMVRERPTALPDHIRFVAKPWKPSDVIDAARVADRGAV